MFDWVEKPVVLPPVVGVEVEPVMVGRVSPKKNTASLLWVVVIAGDERMLVLFFRGVELIEISPARSQGPLMVLVPVGRVTVPLAIERDGLPLPEMEPEKPTSLSPSILRPREPIPV